VKKGKTGRLLEPQGERYALHLRTTIVTRTRHTPTKKTYQGKKHTYREKPAYT